MQRLLAARTFNQGFATVEYVACALVDLDFHSQADARRLRRQRLRDARRSTRIGMPAEIVDAPPADRISRTCSPAAAMRRPITATCGRRCSTPTPSRRSRRPATSSIPATAKALARPRLRRRRRARSGGRSTRPSAAGCRRPRRCSSKRGLVDAARPPAGSSMDLHTAGHRRGVVCAPHARRVEAGPRHPGRRRQRARSHGGDGGDHRRRLSAHERHRRRRLLARSASRRAACAR